MQATVTDAGVRAHFGQGAIGGDVFETQGPDDVLVENNKRFVLFPINYYGLWDAYKRAEALFWTAEDLNFTRDVAAHRAMSDEATKRLLGICVAYMSLQNTFEKYPLEGYLCDEVQAPEARCAFGFFMMQKNIHMEMFSSFFSKIFDHDTAALSRLVSDIEVIPYLKLRCAFVDAYIRNPAMHFSIKLAALNIMVSLCSKSISLILLLIASGAAANASLVPKESIAAQPMPNLLYGMAKIDKDETVFAGFCHLLYSNCMKTRPKPSVVAHILADAVDMELALLKNIAASAVSAPEYIVSTVESAIRCCANEIASRFLISPPFPSTADPIPWSRSILPQVLLLHQDSSDSAPITCAPAAAACIDDSQTPFSTDADF